MIKNKNEHKIRNEFIKSKNHERGTTRRPRLSGEQSRVTKSKG